MGLAQPDCTWHGMTQTLISAGNIKSEPDIYFSDSGCTVKVAKHKNTCCDVSKYKALILVQHLDGYVSA